jgi:hypothetical protein
MQEVTVGNLRANHITRQKAIHHFHRDANHQTIRQEISRTIHPANTLQCHQGVSPHHSHRDASHQTIRQEISGTIRQEISGTIRQEISGTIRQEISGTILHFHQDVSHHHFHRDANHQIIRQEISGTIRQETLLHLRQDVSRHRTRQAMSQMGVKQAIILQGKTTTAKMATM